MSALEGKRVRVQCSLDVYEARVMAVGYNPGACSFVLLVVDDAGKLHEVYHEDATVIPEPVRYPDKPTPTRIPGPGVERRHG